MRLLHVCLLPALPPSLQTPGLLGFPHLTFSPYFGFARHNPSRLPYLHGWVEARVKQGFVFNDVADSRHDGLVEENVAEHPAHLAPHRLLRAGEAELGGADVQTLHGLDLLLAVLRQPVSTQFF